MQNWTIAFREMTYLTYYQLLTIEHKLVLDLESEFDRERGEEKRHAWVEL